jgi:hypothetical protein
MLLVLLPLIVIFSMEISKYGDPDGFVTYEDMQPKKKTKVRRPKMKKGRKQMRLVSLGNTIPLPGKHIGGFELVDVDATHPTEYLVRDLAYLCNLMSKDTMCIYKDWVFCRSCVALDSMTHFCGHTSLVNPDAFDKATYCTIEQLVKLVITEELK